MAKLSKKAQGYVSHKISKLADEGYDDPKQRVAIAMSMGRKKGYDIPKKLVDREAKKKG